MISNISQNRAPWGSIAPWLKTIALVWESDDCLFYPFAVGSHGYGQAIINGKRVLAHRYVCSVVHGRPPSPNLDAAHSCGNKLCMNKRHLRWATRAENEADKLSHGKQARGEIHGQAKLTKDQVLAIRSAPGSQRKIAAKYKITQQTVSDIKLGRRWGWL